jgi:Leucine-rich repeat (LRR) protein
LKITGRKIKKATIENCFCLKKLDLDECYQLNKAILNNCKELKYVNLAGNNIGVIQMLNLNELIELDLAHCQNLD